MAPEAARPAAAACKASRIPIQHERCTLQGRAPREPVHAYSLLQKKISDRLPGRLLRGCRCAETRNLPAHDTPAKLWRCSSRQQTARPVPTGTSARGVHVFVAMLQTRINTAGGRAGTGMARRRGRRPPVGSGLRHRRHSLQRRRRPASSLPLLSCL